MEEVAGISIKYDGYPEIGVITSMQMNGSKPFRVQRWSADSSITSQDTNKTNTSTKSSYKAQNNSDESDLSGRRAINELDHVHMDVGSGPRERPAQHRNSTIQSEYFIQRRKIQSHCFIDKDGVERVCTTDNPSCDYHIQFLIDFHRQMASKRMLGENGTEASTVTTSDSSQKHEIHRSHPPSNKKIQQYHHNQLQYQQQEQQQHQQQQQRVQMQSNQLKIHFEPEEHCQQPQFQGEQQQQNEHQSQPDQQNNQHNYKLHRLRMLKDNVKIQEVQLEHQQLHHLHKQQQHYLEQEQKLQKYQYFQQQSHRQNDPHRRRLHHYPQQQQLIPHNFPEQQQYQSIRETTAKNLRGNGDEGYPDQCQAILSSSESCLRYINPLDYAQCFGALPKSSVKPTSKITRLEPRNENSSTSLSISSSKDHQPEILSYDISCLSLPQLLDNKVSLETSRPSTKLSIISSNSTNNDTADVPGEKIVPITLVGDDAFLTTALESSEPVVSTVTAVTLSNTAVKEIVPGVILNEEIANSSLIETNTVSSNAVSSLPIQSNEPLKENKHKLATQTDNCDNPLVSMKSKNDSTVSESLIETACVSINATQPIEKTSRITNKFETSNTSKCQTESPMDGQKSIDELLDLIRPSEQPIAKVRQGIAELDSNNELSTGELAHQDMFSKATVKSEDINSLSLSQKERPVDANVLPDQNGLTIGVSSTYGTDIDFRRETLADLSKHVETSIQCAPILKEPTFVSVTTDIGVSDRPKDVVTGITRIIDEVFRPVYPKTQVEDSGYIVGLEESVQLDGVDRSEGDGDLNKQDVFLKINPDEPEKLEVDEADNASYNQTTIEEFQEDNLLSNKSYNTTNDVEATNQKLVQESNRVIHFDKKENDKHDDIGCGLRVIHGDIDAATTKQPDCEAESSDDIKSPLKISSSAPIIRFCDESDDESDYPQVAKGDETRDFTHFDYGGKCSGIVEIASTSGAGSCSSSKNDDEQPTIKGGSGRMYERSFKCFQEINNSISNENQEIIQRYNERIAKELLIPTFSNMIIESCLEKESGCSSNGKRHNEHLPAKLSKKKRKLSSREASIHNTSANSSSIRRNTDHSFKIDTNNVNKVHILNNQDEGGESSYNQSKFGESSTMVSQIEKRNYASISVSSPPSSRSENHDFLLWTPPDSPSPSPDDLVVEEEEQEEKEEERGKEDLGSVNQELLSDYNDDYYLYSDNENNVSVSSELYNSGSNDSDNSLSSVPESSAISFHDVDDDDKKHISESAALSKISSAGINSDELGMTSSSSLLHASFSDFDEDSNIDDSLPNCYENSVIDTINKVLENVSTGCITDKNISKRNSPSAIRQSCMNVERTHIDEKFARSRVSPSVETAQPKTPNALWSKSSLIDNQSLQKIDIGTEQYFEVTSANISDDQNTTSLASDNLNVLKPSMLTDLSDVNEKSSLVVSIPLSIIHRGFSRCNDTIPGPEADCENVLLSAATLSPHRENTFQSFKDNFPKNKRRRTDYGKTQYGKGGHLSTTKWLLNKDGSCDKSQNSLQSEINERSEYLTLHWSVNNQVCGPKRYRSAVQCPGTPEEALVCNEKKICQKHEAENRKKGSFSVDKTNLPAFLNPRVLIHDLWSAFNHEDCPHPTKWSEQQLVTYFNTQCTFSEPGITNSCTPSDRPRLRTHKSRNRNVIKRCMKQSSKKQLSQLHKARKDHERKLEIDHLSKLYDAVNRKFRNLVTQ